jgi:WD40 repeat protein
MTGGVRGSLKKRSYFGFWVQRSRIAAGSGGKEALKLWDLTSYQELLTLEAEGSGYWQTCFSPDGNVLGSMNGQGILHLWRAPTWAEINAAEAKDKAESK